MSNNIKNKFRGVFTALITPFNTDGSIDYGALKDLVEWQIVSGIHGLVPAGTTGESPTLNHQEHFKVIEAVVEQTKTRVPIIAGTGSNSTQEAIALTQAVIDLGIDATLQVTPYYNKPSQEGIYRHFNTIAEQAPIPQIIYNIPGRTSKNIEPTTMSQLLKHPLIVGVKEATGNILQSIDILHEHPDIAVLSGDDNIAFAIVAHGGHGVISVTSNIAPTLMVEMIELVLNCEIEKARILYNKLLPLFKYMFIDTNPIPVKYFASKLKLCQEQYRLPMCELSQEYKTLIDKLIERSSELKK